MGVRGVRDDDADDGEGDDGHTETGDGADGDFLGAGALDYPE